MIADAEEYVTVDGVGPGLCPAHIVRIVVDVISLVQYIVCIKRESKSGFLLQYSKNSVNYCVIK